MSPALSARRRVSAGFQIVLHVRRTPKESLLEDLRRVSRQNGGRPFTAATYKDQGTFSPSAMIHRFGSWNAALAAAGLPIGHAKRVPVEALLTNLADVWRKLGRQPGVHELVKHRRLSKYAPGTYQKRFGSWNKALQAFDAFVNGGGAPAATAPAPKRRPLRTPRLVNWRLRATVLIRDNCICRMCGASPAKDPAVTLHVDHIVPWSKGGPTIADNLQTLCATCNIGKSDLAMAATAAPSPSTPRSPAHRRRRSRQASRSRADGPPDRGSG